MPVIHRQLHRQAQRPPSWNDGDFVNRIGPRDELGHQRMPRLVVGRGALLLIGQDHAPALHPHQHLVLGKLKVLQLDDGLVQSRRQERRFIDEVLEIGPGEPGRAA